MTTDGLQCIFPFKYKNETTEGNENNLVFKKCATEDLYSRSWCPTGRVNAGDHKLYFCNMYKYY